MCNNNSALVIKRCVHVMASEEIKKHSSSSPRVHGEITNEQSPRRGKKKSARCFSSRVSVSPREVRSESNVNRTGVASTPTPRCLSTDFALWRTFAESSSASSSRCWTCISSLRLSLVRKKKSVDAFSGKNFFFFRKKSKQHLNQQCRGFNSNRRSRSSRRRSLLLLLLLWQRTTLLRREEKVFCGEARDW